MKAATVAANRPVCGQCQSRSTLQDQGRTKVRMPVVLPSQFFGRATSSSFEAFRYVSHIKSWVVSYVSYCFDRANLHGGTKGILEVTEVGLASEGERVRGK